MKNIFPVTDERMLKECIDYDTANHIIARWKPEYGEMIDFGGGEKDVFVSDLLGCTHGKAAKAMQLFDLHKDVASAVIAQCARG